MKTIKIILFTIALIATAQACAMEAPPAPPSQQPLIPITPLTKLPGDIQRILYTETMDGGLYQTAHTVLALARTSKQLRAYINDNMVMLLESFSHTAKAIRVRQILQNKNFSLPVMQSEEIIQWCNNAIKMGHENGKELLCQIFFFSGELGSSAEKKLFQDVQTLLENKNINVNYVGPHGYNRTSLMYAVQRHWFDIVRMLLDAGADPDIKDEFDDTTAFTRAHNGTMHGYKICEEIKSLLVAYGANPSLKTKWDTQRAVFRKRKAE